MKKVRKTSQKEEWKMVEKVGDKLTEYSGSREIEELEEVSGEEEKKKNGMVKKIGDVMVETAIRNVVTMIIGWIIEKLL